VLEYPYIWSLGSTERATIRDWERSLSPLPEHVDYAPAMYQYLLSTCPGSKIGGYPDWGGQDANVPLNSQSNPADYLLTISDDEWDGGSFPRWRPMEQPSPPDGIRRLHVTPEGYVNKSIAYTPEEETELAAWDNARWSRYQADSNAIGTYLKVPMNIYLDRTVTPWRVMTT
jgi:hypothetical protein